MPTSTARPPAMSTTGIGLRATAAPVASAKFQISRLAASSRMRTLRATISACRSPAIKQRIQGDQGFALALEHVEDAGLERLDQGRGPFPLDLGRAVGELDLDLVGVGPGGRHDDVVGTDQVFDPLVLDLGVDLVAVELGIAVDLVEDEDDRLLGLAQLGQGFDLPALHVAGDDEEDQIGVAGDVAGQGLADLAADLVDARRIDHDELGPFEAGAVRVACCQRWAAPGRRAVGRADLEDVLAHQGVQDRRLAPAFVDALRRALAHYGVHTLDGSPKLKESLLWICKAHQRMEQQSQFILDILERRLRLVKVRQSLPNGSFRTLLDRMISITRELYPSVSDLAREVRYRYFDQPLFERARSKVYEEAEDHLAYLAAYPDAADCRARIRSLIDCPQLLAGLFASRFSSADLGLRLKILEVLTSRYYKTRTLENLNAPGMDGH